MARPHKRSSLGRENLAVPSPLHLNTMEEILWYSLYSV
jgi:hypothetical protein